MLFLSSLLLSLVAYSSAVVLPLEDFTRCQRDYDESIGELVASEGMSAASSVWRILFNSLDLNRNHLLSASEVVLKLNEDNIAPTTEMSELLPQIQTWINSAKSQDGDQELSLSEFIDIVGETIGRVETTTQRSSFEAVSDICTYFNQRIPLIISSIRNLSNCTSVLKRDQVNLMESDAVRGVVNAWKSVFATIDQDDDSEITQRELADAYLSFNRGSNMSTSQISDYLNSYLGDVVLSRPEMIAEISTLLFGTPDNRVWINITSIDELKGKEVTCSVLRSTKNEVTGQLKENEKCIDMYNNALERILGEDASIAPSFIFAYGDVNKDGTMTSDELASLATQGGESDERFSVRILFDGTDRSFNLNNLSTLLPDRVVGVKGQNQDDVFELTPLSCSQHKTWNKFCLSAIRVIQAFPSIGHNNDQDNSDENNTISSLIADLRDQLQARGAVIGPDIQQAIRNLADLFPQTSTVAAATTYGTGTGEPTIGELSTAMNFRLIGLSTTLPSQETTHESTTSPLSNMTSSVTTEESLPGIMRDVIGDLTNENDTGVGGERNDELATLMTALNETSNSDVAKEGSFSKEEQELYDLLTVYHSQIVQQKNVVKSALTGGSSSFVDLSSKMTSEELELQQLLKKAIKEQRD